MKDNVNLEFIKHTVHNYSSYILSEQEKIALSFGWEQHNPNRSCKNSIYTSLSNFIKEYSITYGKMISTELKQRWGLIVKNTPALMCHISIEK